MSYDFSPEACLKPLLRRVTASMAMATSCSHRAASDQTRQQESVFHSAPSPKMVCSSLWETPKMETSCRSSCGMATLCSSTILDQGRQLFSRVNASTMDSGTRCLPTALTRMVYCRSMENLVSWGVCPCRGVGCSLLWDGVLNLVEGWSLLWYEVLNLVEGWDAPCCGMKCSP